MNRRREATHYPKKEKKKSATIGCGRVEACNPVEQTMRRHHASFRFN